MKELFPSEQQEQAQPKETGWSRWRVESHQQIEAKQEAPSEDHYAWMNPCDRWMIGRPADKACWDYIERMIVTRERRAPFMVDLYLLGITPPPINLYFAFSLLLRWWRK